MVSWKYLQILHCIRAGGYREGSNLQIIATPMSCIATLYWQYARERKINKKEDLMKWNQTSHDGCSRMNLTSSKFSSRRARTVVRAVRRRTRAVKRRALEAVHSDKHGGDHHESSEGVECHFEIWKKFRTKQSRSDKSSLLESDETLVTGRARNNYNHLKLQQIWASKLSQDQDRKVLHASRRLLYSGKSGLRTFHTIMGS